MTNSPLDGKCIFLIGGETPLGRAIAVGLAERGAGIAIASLSADTRTEFAINSALNELWAMGRKGLALPIDASDANRVRDAVAAIEQELGTIDLAVIVADDQQPIALEALPGGQARISTHAPPAEALKALTDRLATTPPS